MKRILFAGQIMLLSAALLIAVGCSESDNPAGSAGDELTTDDIEVISEDFSRTLAAEDEGLLTDYLAAPAPTPPAGGPRLTPSHGDTNHHNRGNLNVTRVRIFYDAEGNEMERFVPDSTVMMDKLLWIEGTRTNRRGTRTVMIDHHDSVRVEGLSTQDSVRTLNGLGQREVSSEFTGMDSTLSHSFEGRYAFTTTGLRIQRGHPYPLDGEIAVNAYRHRLIDRNGVEREIVVEVSFTVTFDGTSVAVMTMEDGTVYEIDLDEARPHRRGQGGPGGGGPGGPGGGGPGGPGGGGRGGPGGGGPGGPGGGSF
jgi:hypothetical protein